MLPSTIEATQVQRHEKECQRSLAFVTGNMGTSPLPFPPWASLADLEHELLGDIIGKTHSLLTCLNCSKEETPTGCLVLPPVPRGFPLHAPSSAKRAGRSGVVKPLPTAPQEGHQESGSLPWRCVPKSPPGRAAGEGSCPPTKSPQQATGAPGLMPTKHRAPQPPSRAWHTKQPPSHVLVFLEPRAPVLRRPGSPAESGCLSESSSEPEQLKPSQAFLSMGGGMRLDNRAVAVMATFLGNRGSEAKILQVFGFFLNLIFMTSMSSAMTSPEGICLCLLVVTRLAVTRVTDSGCCKEASFFLGNVGQGQTKVSVSEARMMP